MSNYSNDTSPGDTAIPSGVARSSRQLRLVTTGWNGEQEVYMLPNGYALEGGALIILASKSSFGNTPLRIIPLGSFKEAVVEES